MRVEVTAKTTQAQPEPTVAALPVARWMLAIAVFVIPLSFSPSLVDEFVLPKLLLARLLVMVLALVLVAGWMRLGAVTWKRTPLDLPLLAFIVSAAISTVFAVNINLAIFGTYDRWEGLLTIATYALLFWCCRLAWLRRSRVPRGSAPFWAWPSCWPCTEAGYASCL